MKSWSDHGAFGNDIIELSFWEIMRLLWKGELDDRRGTVLSFGKSKRPCHSSHTREQQIGEVP